MTIDGTVSNVSNGAGIDQAKVEFYNKTTMTLQNQTFSNSSGYYSAQFTYVGQIEHKTTLDDKIYPNPSIGQTTVRFDAEQSGPYTIRITDVSGKKLYTSTINVQEGIDEFILNGGNAGIHFVTVDNNKGDKHTFKSIQTSNSGAGFSNSEAVQVSNSNLKSTIDNPNSLDSLLIVYSHNGFVTGTETVAPGTQTQNIALQPSATTFNFIAYALTITGDTIKPGNEISNVSINVKRNSDNTVMNFPAVNGVFHITWQETGTPSTSIEISNPDTTLVTEYTIGMKRDSLINTKEMNLFQNTKDHSGPPGTPYIPPGPATATLANLPDSMDIYFVQRLVEAANGYGTYSTRSETFRTMVAGDDPYVVRKFETTLDTIYWFEMQKDKSHPTNNIPDQRRLEQKQALDTVQSLNVNGK
jgi:hypothetical protein